MCDRDALANNTLRMLELSLIFQDGEIHHAPGGGDLPEMLDLSSLPQSQQGFTFFAALPSFKPYGGNFAPDGQLIA
jgi:type VI secretion system protein ImpJ